MGVLSAAGWALVGLSMGLLFDAARRQTTRSESEAQLSEMRALISTLRGQLSTAQRMAASSSASGCQAASPGSSGKGSQLGSAASGQRWGDTPNNRLLQRVLSGVANSRGEIMLGIANDVMMCTNRKTCWWNGGNVLETFLKGVTRLGIKNSVTITLDDATEQFCRDFPGEVTSIRMELPVPTAQQGSRGANMISTLKYGLLRQALLMGFSVLVVDLDLVFLRNPFDHLYRDADVEASTDGFNAAWAGGKVGSVHEPKMGWGAGGLYIQHFTLNVGCAFFRPTEKTIDLLARVAKKLSQAASWDQQVFNEEVFMLSHGAYNGSKVGVRVMDYMQWVNSKVFFFSMRQNFFPGKATPPGALPVMIHMNYHPDKHKRMLCVWARYIEGKHDACDAFPAGG